MAASHMPWLSQFPVRGRHFGKTAYQHSDSQGLSYFFYCTLDLFFFNP